MEHDNARDIAVTPEVRRNGHMEFGRVQVGQFMEAQRSLMTIDTIDLFLPVPRPERPKYKIGPIRSGKQRETIDSPMFADPVPSMHMIGMGVLCESSSLGLLRREEALLLFGEVEEPTRCFSVRLCHNTILQFICRYGTTLS